MRAYRETLRYEPHYGWLSKRVTNWLSVLLINRELVQFSDQFPADVEKFRMGCWSGIVVNWKESLRVFSESGTL